MLGIGIWLHVSKGAYASLAPSFNFLSATALCIAAGAIVLLVGFLGCCGAIMENQCLLLTVSNLWGFGVGSAQYMVYAQHVCGRPGFDPVTPKT